MARDTIIRRARIYAALLAVVTVAAAPERRIVAIGDVHGDLVDFAAILQQTNLMNDRRQWIGGGDMLVQTGDIVDRGPRSRECLDLLMELERQARKKNGTVIALLGNHEAMAMMGDLGYVSPEDYQGFVTPQSERIREKAYRDYLDFVSWQSKQARHTTVVEQTTREKWMADHPIGFFERRDAFGPQGVYGRWLRGHDGVVQVGNVLFVHGGLNPGISFHDVRELNQRIRSDLAAFDSIWESLSQKKVIWRYMTIEEALRQAQSEWTEIQTRQQVEPEVKEELQKFLSFSTWYTNSANSPLWYRGLALDPEETLSSGVDAMLARLKIGYIVAGHTPQPNFQINDRFGNRVFLIDTGMLKSVFGGRASALEIQEGRFTAFYTNEKPQVLSAPARNASIPLAPSKGSGPPR